ncbi:plectin-like isoform X28 [Anguilla anguilla]|uniref:plectin-like isoform X28 n=1 Tax=Anguilla anguilla TaxID=7936 RepID=UPI0015B0C940|nr:plectin-like isoform X28 [Anguilla anguilla]
MVAGMVMPLEDLRAIYELLFRDGVLVAKKDKRPQTKHPEIQAVTNLQVMRAMGSLKSRGYVRETFAWRHFYWYLTNEGIVYLRDYLRLPPEIVPSSLQRVRRPATTLNIAHRAARVQTVDGPISYALKPNSRVGAESQESLMDRQGYRRKRTADVNEEVLAERMPRFRGRPMAADKPRASWEFGAESQPGFRDGEVRPKEVGWMKEESQLKRTSAVKFSQPHPDAKDGKPTAAVTSEEKIFGRGRKGAVEMAEVQKISMSRDAKSASEQTASKIALPAAAAPAMAATAAAAVAVVMGATPTKEVKQKAKKADAVKVAQETPKPSPDPATTKPAMAAIGAESPLLTGEVKAKKTSEVKIAREPLKKGVKEDVTTVLAPAPMLTPPQSSGPSGAKNGLEGQVMKTSMVKVVHAASKQASPEPAAGVQAVVGKTEETAVTVVVQKKELKIAKTQKSPEPSSLPIEPVLLPASAASAANKVLVKSEIKSTFEEKVTLEQPDSPLAKIPAKVTASTVVAQREASDNKPTQGAPQTAKENTVSKSEPPVEAAEPIPSKGVSSRQVAQGTPKPSLEVITAERAVPAKAETADEVKVTAVELTATKTFQTSATIPAPLQETAAKIPVAASITSAGGEKAEAGKIPVAESITSAGGEKAEPGKAAKVSERGETPIISVEVTKTAALPAPAEKAQAVEKGEAPAPPEVLAIKNAPGPSPLTVPSALITPSAAVRSQASAPTDKGKAEPAEFTEENMKQEVPELSSESKPPAAALAAARAAAGADASTRAVQGGPPSLTSDYASLAEQKQDRGAELHKASADRHPTPAAQLATAPESDPESESLDPAAMRKKIVVVEEVIEVQHLNAAQASEFQQQGQILPPDTDLAGQDIDIDILTELAQERAAKVEAEGGPGAPCVFAEQDWDHDLEEPEEKTWPNFIEDERDRVQKKTFTKWVNKHLIKHWSAESQRHVTDLYEDLRDGHNLISLLEVLSGDTLPRERDVVRNLRLPREKGRMRFHKLQNVQIALDFLKHRQVKLVNIRNDDIADGNPKLTLGLIWTIILHFQISDIQVNGQSDDMTAKEKLLLWSQRMAEGYQGIRCDNFTTSWRDGKLFNAVIHKHQPRLIDMGRVYQQSNLENLEQAFSVAEKDLGVTRLLDPEDVDVPHPDEKSIITYVSSLYDAMPRVPDVQDGVKANELELRWQEYYEVVTLLLQWITHHSIVFEERRFPTSYEEIEILWRQFLKFKETELPAKESDKNRSKHIYKSLEGAVQAGQIKVPPRYHPIDVEKEWGRLHVAILERERLLRTEFERLERLQRIVSKVQMESGVCEEQLNQVETLLQSDIRLLNAGKPAMNTREVDKDLDKADGMIRLLFNDVQLLKDGRHLQAEQMYRRVYRLHERLVNLRTEYNLRLKSGVTTTEITKATISMAGQQSSMKMRPELDEVTLRYVQDLLAWVEENQRRIETSEWGSDLPTVESQLGSHRGLHQTIEDFRSKIERARADESQLSPVSKGAYRDYLGKLDQQYAKLLISSKSRLRHLDQLHAFVIAATKELMWLNEKEEEEVHYDWSNRNTNMTAKKDNYSGLMRELELREKKVNEIQATGERLLKEGHPGRKTVEAFTAALQTQWSWILQLCCCIEAHLKENTAYYQFFSDVKEAEERLKKMQENMRKKYTCDRSVTVTRLEDLLQDAMEEKEQLNEFKTHIAGLNKRAKTIIQLKPRDPATSLKGKLPVQAVCDFKQMEITVHKGEECALLNNSQPYKWKVLNKSGNESVVPSVCFIIPPVNKEAMDSVSNLDGTHQNVVSMWQRLHIDLRSMLSWQYLMRDIQQVRSWNILMFKTMKVEEYKIVLRNLELHYQEFMRDSQDSQLFDADDRMQIEGDYNKSTQYYDNLMRSVEKGSVVSPQGEKDESVCKSYISQIKDLRLQLEDCEARTVNRIRQPVDKDPLKDCAQRASEQKKIQIELESIKKNLDKVAEKTEDILASPQQSSSTPMLRSEFDITLQKMGHIYSLSSIYLDKLKTIELVIRNTQEAEDVLKTHEDRLREVNKVPNDLKEVETYRTQLKKMRAEAEGKQPVFDGLEDEVRKATTVSERMSRVHSERDSELDHYRHLLGSLQERWQAIFAQIDVRQRELEQLGRQLGYYRESYDWLIRWIADAKQRQEKIQAVPISDSKTLKEQLAQEKKLLEEIEKNKEKVDECQKYAKGYIDAIKDYELQLVTYKALVEPLASPLKKTKMESASDNIIQEYVTLRTRYSELMTLTSQYIKFITDTQRRLEDEEMATAQQEQIKQEKTILQQTFITEKEMLLKKEKLIEDEKKKLEKQFEDEVNKAKALKDEQERQKKAMEEERKKLQATMDAALKKQKEAEEEMRNKQKEMQDLEKKRLEQEKLLAEENKKLREKLQQLQVTQEAPTSHTREIEIQTDAVPEGELVHSTMVGTSMSVPNGQGATDDVDSQKRNGESPFAFDGIREKVPASRLYEIGLLSKKEYDKLKKGKTTVQDLSQTDKLKTYLKGKNCIGGVLLDSNNKMSIYQAMKEKKLTPGSAVVLLEAQAASGYVIDPVKNKKLSVNEAVKEGLLGPELHNKLLSAEKAVTGYKDPYSGGKISLFEAMKKNLIVRDHAIRLLEAQIATGGIIDPVNSHRLPIETAYKQGQFDAEMYKILADPSDDTKGFFDPNTQENLTYQQLMDRCVTDPETGVVLLPITEKAAKSERSYTDEETKDVFNKTTVSVPFGRFKGKTITIWEIINSEYFTEEQRKDLIRQYRTGKITVEKIIKIVITVAEEKEKKKEIAFDGLRAPVPATELLESKIIDKDLYNKLHKGNKSVKEVSELEPVKKALKGTNCIAGVIIESSKEKMPLYQAMKKDLLRKEPALHLLEAQAGTGFIIDPVSNQKLTVDEAVKAGVVGPELHEKLLSAERAVTGYKDPYTGKTVSLFEAMQKELINKDQAIRLLEAQVATGGIIDPVKSHRIPDDVAYKRGYYDEDMNQILSNPTDDTKCFFDPNTQENVTYSQLLNKCVTDKTTGLQLLPLSEKAINAKEETTYTEVQTKEVLNQTTVELDSGPFKGRKVTIWEIINSEYLTEEQRLELIRQYRTGKVTIEKIVKIVITIIDEKESKKQDQANLKGLRAPVPASSLLSSKIIDKPTFDQLQQGKKTPKEISEVDSVKKYLQGTDSIAGIFVEPTKEKMSIYQAMKKKLLRQNTGLSLLEAQAATGFIVDPVKNQCLTVDEAVKASIVGPELHEKLLSAEKAVTGYHDPYTGEKISIFQAMQKELIPKEHAMPLLEAQVVSGGIIDPVNSHRLPIDVAFQRGFLNKKTADTLAEPSDETKAFSDPNTDESVTYKQLKERCMRDPGTGLCFVPLSKPQAPTVVEKTYLYTEEQTQNDLSSTQVDIPHESFAGQSMSLWDVMNSNLLPEEERLKLLEEYRAGKITKERMIIIIIEIMEQREIIKTERTMTCDMIRRRVTIEELYSARIIDLETYNLLKQEKKTIREVMEMPNVKKYLFGTGSIAGVMADSSSKIGLYHAMKRGLLKPEIALSLLEAQAATGFIIDPVRNEMLTVDEAVRKNVVGPEIHDKLLSAERAVTGYRDPYSGKIISIFQAMKKALIPEEYALKLLDAQAATGGIMDPEFNFHLPTDVAIQRGYINKETNEKLSGDLQEYVDPMTEEKMSYAQLLKRCKVDGDSGMRLLSLADRRLLFKGLRKQITMEELIRSQIIDQKTVAQLNEGLITVEEVSRTLQKYLEGTSCISGVFIESNKDRLSIYQAMKKNMIRPGTAFELLEAQAATGYVIDPIKNLKLTVNEAVRMGIVGPEFKDKLLSAERAVTGYRDPYSGKTISLFQAMKKGLILKDHGIRLLEAQIATGGIIDPEESHRLPVEIAYKRGLFDEEMNEILTDPSDDTKGFFDPNTEENLTYLQLMERCITDPETGLVLLLLKEKKRERKTSSKSSVRKRRVVIVDPETGKEMSVYEAYRKGLIDHQTYLELAEQECEWEEITITSSDGVVKSMIIDRRSGRQYDIDDALAKALIDKSSLEQYRAGTLSITEFADMLSGNMGGIRSRSSSFGSTSSYPMSPIPSLKTPATIWNDPSEETGPVAGILDTDTLEKVSITEAMHRNLVDNITGQRLLEAQACTGGIIDPSTGEKFSVADAVNKGLVDKIMVDRINLAQKAYNGFEDPRTKTRMSAAQALKKGWLYYEAGQRFLEVQYLTGGLIEPDIPGRVTIDDAIKKGTLDARTAQKLRDVSAYTKYLTCPKTKLKISYKDAMDRSMIEEGSSLRLLEASSTSSKGLYSPYNVSGSGSTSGSRSGSRTGSRSGSRRGSFDATGSGFTMNLSSSTYSSTSYGRRYDAGPHSGLNMDQLMLALTAVKMSRTCGSEERAIFTTTLPMHSPVA